MLVVLTVPSACLENIHCQIMNVNSVNQGLGHSLEPLESVYNVNKGNMELALDFLEKVKDA